MFSVPYSKSTRVLLSSVPAVLLLLTQAASYSPTLSPHLNTCFLHREHTLPPPPWIPLRDSVLHNYSVLILWLSLFFLALLPRQRPKAIFTLTYTSLWFHTTYIILAVLKAPLDDFNCAGRHAQYPNGISGHYCYFLFVAFTARVYAHSRLRVNPAVPRLYLALTSLLLLVFTVGGTATLYRTYFHGYHSPRQIALGSALGIASHVALEYFLFRPEHEPPLHIALMFQAATSLTAFTLYSAVWPHETAGHAINSSHVIFHLTLWLVLLLSAWVSARSTAKIATD